MSTSEYSIRVETNQTNPPKPLGFCVVRGNDPVAWLTYDQVKFAVQSFKEMAKQALDLPQAG